MHSLHQFYIVRECCTVLTFKKLFLILCFILSGVDVYRTFYRYNLNMNVDEFIEILRPSEPGFSSRADDKTKSCVSDIVHVVLFQCFFFMWKCELQYKLLFNFNINYCLTFIAVKQKVPLNKHQIQRKRNLLSTRKTIFNKRMKKTKRNRFSTLLDPNKHLQKMYSTSTLMFLLKSTGKYVVE